ncbi:MAG: pantetheine-phosphate adenylyltransferase [Nitrospira sp.]|nr:pantetheine-phosphate adenylyltransferase [Nitrospira sp.]
MKKIGVYPGTFDPVTYGHIDIIKRSLKVFDKVIVAVAPSLQKAPLFDVDERVLMIKEATRDFKNLQIEQFEGLLVEFVQRQGGSAVIRGLRAVSDFEYELQMALMNRKLDSEVETVFMMPSEEYTYLTSSIVKAVASYGGEVKDFVPEIVLKKLKEKLGKKHL